MTIPKIHIFYLIYGIIIPQIHLNNKHKKSGQHTSSASFKYFYQKKSNRSRITYFHFVYPTVRVGQDTGTNFVQFFFQPCRNISAF